MNNQLVTPRDPVALLVLRVWLEHGSRLPLRAYIRKTNDVSVGFNAPSTLTDVEAAVDEVRSWLEGLLEAPADGGANGAAPSPQADPNVAAPL
jgi:hypothetical protein